MTRLPTLRDLKDWLQQGIFPMPQDRLRWRKAGDAVALGVAAGMIVAMALLPGTGKDILHYYIPLAIGELENVWYPPWARPMFELLAAVPFQIGYVALMAVSLLTLIGATRVLNGRLPFVLLTYQFGSLLYWGQIDALVVIGLAAGWWGLQRKNPWIAGIGFSLASVKPQTSLPALLLLWWWFDRSGKIKSLIPPALVLLLSFWRYGWWLPHWLNPPQRYELIRPGSIALWEFVGPWVLLLWIPALLARLPRKEKLLLFLATTPLTMPYYQQKALLCLQVFPIGWLAWLGNMGFLLPVFGWNILEWIVLLPVALYVRCAWSGCRQLWLELRHAQA
jgi:hypothetical protein